MYQQPKYPNGSGAPSQATQPARIGLVWSDAPPQGPVEECAPLVQEEPQQASPFGQPSAPTPFTIADVKSWLIPPIQRPLTVNAKVMELMGQIRESQGLIPGVIHLGVVKGVIYLLDGQHRLHAFELSLCPVGRAHFVTLPFESIGAMGETFAKLNGALVRMKPDDYLRSLEPTNEGLQRLRKLCPFVGYGSIRRGNRNSGAVISASMVIKVWLGGRTNTPSGGSLGGSVVSLMGHITVAEADAMGEFYVMAYEAWGPDREYAKLWTGLNLIIIAWLYRHVMLDPARVRAATLTKLTPEQFSSCMMALSADAKYLQWLGHPRFFSEQNRGPCYARVKAIFQRQYTKDNPGKPRLRLPDPEWASGRPTGRSSVVELTE
jgi:hypothetical protein